MKKIKLPVFFVMLLLAFWLGGYGEVVALTSTFTCEDPTTQMSGQFENCCLDASAGTIICYGEGVGPSPDPSCSSIHNSCNSGSSGNAFESAINYFWTCTVAPTTALCREAKPGTSSDGYSYHLSHGGNRTVVAGYSVGNIINALFFPGSAPVSPSLSITMSHGGPTGFSVVPPNFGLSAIVDTTPQSVSGDITVLTTTGTAPGAYTVTASAVPQGGGPSGGSCWPEADDTGAPPGEPQIIYYMTCDNAESYCESNTGNASRTCAAAEFLAYAGRTCGGSSSYTVTDPYPSGGGPGGIFSCNASTLPPPLSTTFNVTVYGPPTGLTATAGACVSGDVVTPVNLSWTAPNNAVIGYAIYRDGVWLEDIGASQTTYQDNSLSSASTYTYGVAALYAGGESAQVTAQVTTTVCGALPSGTISASSCSIPLSASTCNTSVTWTTANLTANPTSVNKNSPSGTSISSATSGTVSDAVSFGTNIYYLRHNNVGLANASMNASCASGTWNGTTCSSNSSTLDITVVRKLYGGGTAPSGGSCFVNGEVKTCVVPVPGLPAEQNTAGVTDASGHMLRYTVCPTAFPNCAFPESLDGLNTVSFFLNSNKTVEFTYVPFGTPVSCGGTVPPGQGVLLGQSTYTPPPAKNWQTGYVPKGTTPGICQWTCDDGYRRLGNEYKCRPIPGYIEI